MQHKMSKNGFELLGKYLDKINKTSKKFGVQGLTPSNVETIYQPKMVDGVEVMEEIITFNLNMDAPVVEGYKVIATLDNKEGKNIFYMAFGEDVDEEDLVKYRESVTCEHCNKRRLRRITYILKHEETGELVQIGATCMDKFVGGNYKSLMHFAKMEIDIDSFEKESKKRESQRTLDEMELAKQYFVRLDKLLALQINEVNQKGYVHAHHGFNSTHYKVWHKAFRPIERLDELMSMHRNTIVEVKNWAKTLNSNTDTFLYNLSVIASREIVNEKESRMACAMYYAYLKENGLLKPKVEDTPKGQNWVGTEGQAITVENGKILFVKPMTTIYGDTELVLMADENGNVFKWFNSTAKRLEKDDVISIKAKVKKHDEYSGNKQNLLSYVKYQ